MKAIPTSTTMRELNSYELKSLMVDMGDVEVGSTSRTRPCDQPKFTSSSLPAIMRRFALFVDGMTRAMILPFGPTLVLRLVYGRSEIHSSTWSGVA